MKAVPALDCEFVEMPTGNIVVLVGCILPDTCLFIEGLRKHVVAMKTFLFLLFRVPCIDMI